MDRIESVAELEELVGGRPLPALLKSIDALDAHCARLLSLSPFAAIGFRDDAGGARAAALGGPPGRPPPIPPPAGAASGFFNST
jgi:hypothetical protein